MLIVEDEPHLAETIRDGLRLEAVAADIRGPSGDGIAQCVDRRRARNRPPVREIAGLRLDPFRREVHRDGRCLTFTRRQLAVLEVLVGAEVGAICAEDLLERAWDENADPFTNAVRVPVSALYKRLSEPAIIATVPSVGYRIETQPAAGPEGGDRG